MNPVTLQKVDADKKYQATSGGLVWNNTGPASAHGTFNVATTFAVDQSLSDNTTPAAYFGGWDGKTLTKTGAGTLILSGDNRYTGGTVLTEGAIRLGSDTALGTGTLFARQKVVGATPRLLITEDRSITNRNRQRRRSSPQRTKYGLHVSVKATPTVAVTKTDC